MEAQTDLSTMFTTSDSLTILKTRSLLLPMAKIYDTSYVKRNGDSFVFYKIELVTTSLSLPFQQLCQCGGKLLCKHGLFCGHWKILDLSIPYLISRNWWSDENCKDQCSRKNTWCDQTSIDWLGRISEVSKWRLLLNMQLEQWSKEYQQYHGMRQLS